MKTILIVVLLGLLVVFVIQNAATVEVNFLVWSMKLPRAVLYVVIFAAGAMIGWLSRYLGGRRN